MSHPGQNLTKELLARAHSPDSVDRIYTEKIQHRTLHLRPSSPPPSVVSQRAARRKKREQEKSKKKQRPAPLSARERRKLGLHDIPREGQKYEIYEPLNKLWMGYIHELLDKDIYHGGSGAAAKLAAAEFHGARVEVVRSRCHGRVGIAGIVVRDRKFVWEIVTKKNGVKIVPKEGTTFRVAVDAPDAPKDATTAQGDTTQPEGQPDNNTFAFELLGDQLMQRSADRANRKYKAHFLKDL